MLGAYRQTGAARPERAAAAQRAGPSYQSSTYGVPVARKWPTLMHSRPADPQAAGQRLVHVAEQQVPRLSLPDGVEQRLAATFHPLRYRVEEQLRDVRRDVRAQHVDRADGRHLRRVDLVVELVGRPVHACAARRRRSRTTSRRARSARRQAHAGRAAGARPTCPGCRRCRRSGRQGVGMAANSSAYCRRCRRLDDARPARRPARPTAGPTSPWPRRIAAPSAAR